MCTGCCTLECLARTIGWLQVASGCLLVLYLLISVINVIGTDTPHHKQVIITQIKENLTMVQVNEETIGEEKVAATKTVTVAVQIIFILFYLAMIILASTLLTGIRKKNPKLVRTWVMVNGCMCCLVAGFILFQLGSMLLANDPGSLTTQIIWLVLHCLQVWVVHAYYEETKDQIVSTSY